MMVLRRSEHRGEGGMMDIFIDTQLIYDIPTLKYKVII